MPENLARLLTWIIWRFIGFVSFNRIRIVNRENLPRGGPVLYVGLHRNGVMDGAPYFRAAPRARFVISAQWHRSLIGRVVFPGFTVARRKDRERGISADNRKAFAAVLEHFNRGGQAFILPEGTSALGPRHLPFKPGAAKLALEAAAKGTALTVVPLGIHYECAWEWQSRVEVLVGEPFTVPAYATTGENDLQERIARSLKAVGVNVGTEEELRFVEALAYAATLGAGRSYSECLKRFEVGVPAGLRDEARSLIGAARAESARFHQGVPLVVSGPVLLHALWWLLLCPIETAALVLNAPALVVGRWAAKRFPDELNVVALWRALVGIPVGLAWATLTALWIAIQAGTGWALTYLCVTGLGIRFYYRFNTLTIALYNALFRSGLKARVLAFQDCLARSVDGTTS